MRLPQEQESSTSPGQNRGVPRLFSDRRTRADESPDSRRFESLIVVSNRQPYRHEYEKPDGDEVDAAVSDGGPAESSASVRPPSTNDVERTVTVDRPTGGLTAGLDPVLQRAGGTWIAWGDGDADREVADDRGCVAVPPEEPSYTLQRVWLDDAAVEAYYYGFSNRVLWPICHEFPHLVDDRPGDFEGYRDVNRQFADAVSEHVTGDAVVWLQDYHLGLAPSMIRERVPSSTTIGQFWHVPWPNPDVFRWCPHGWELLEGLLGNDLLGFHVDRYVAAFLECADRSLPSATVDRARGIVRHDGSVTRVVATPMGVDAAKHDRQCRELDGTRIDRLRERYDVPATAALGVGVDRLDYTKGIPERLAAIERFFERYPAWRGSFTIVQTTTPSRTEIPAYDELGTFVRREVERINDRFATERWRPIVYTEDYLPRSDLCALYRHADVMLVTPLIDGMNLVAQEYVAASVDGTGALLLSEHVGAHDTLGDAAYTVDPDRIDQVATTLETALASAPAERRRRLAELRRRVFEHDLEWWMDSQLAALAETASGRSRDRRGNSVSTGR